MPTPNHQSWFLYALGGGFGHLTRAAALARALQSRAPDGLDLHLLTNSSFAQGDLLRHELGPNTRLHRLDPKLATPTARRRVIRLLNEIQPKAIVVDVFPRGLGGELAEWLPDCGAVRILTHRDLNPRYVHRYQLAKFVRRNFELILAPGELGSLVDTTLTVRTNPWLIRGHGELASFEDSRRALGAGQDKPLIAVTRSGRIEEGVFFEQLAERLQGRYGEAAYVRLIKSPNISETNSRASDVNELDGGTSAKTQGNILNDDTGLKIWPLLPWMRGVDAIVGGGGYNTVQEARMTGTPLIAFAQKRLYDRQRRRLNDDEVVEDYPSAIRRLDAVLAGAEQRRRLPNYSNGASEAARACLAYVDSNPPGSAVQRGKKLELTR